MRAIVTRVGMATVKVENRIVGSIGKGFLVLLGVHEKDTEEIARKMADKITGLRIFPDSDGKMNRSPKDVQAELLVVSQFTLYADTGSRRPGFTSAARPDQARRLYEAVLGFCKEKGFLVEAGEFGCDMAVASVNEGPVTIILDSETW